LAATCSRQSPQGPSYQHGHEPEFVGALALGRAALFVANRVRFLGLMMTGLLLYPGARLWMGDDLQKRDEPVEFRILSWVGKDSLFCQAAGRLP
jgi:hypothetical protein